MSERNGHQSGQLPTVTLNEDDEWVVHVDGRHYGPFNKIEAEEWLDQWYWQHRAWPNTPWFLHPMFWWTLAAAILVGIYFTKRISDAYWP